MALGTQHLAYRAASTLRIDELSLQTAGGRVADRTVQHPRFFAGALKAARPCAVGLTVLADLAAADFRRGRDGSVARATSRDPIVTCGGRQLRFEALSACCGGYARLDVLPAALDGDTYAHGTTNGTAHLPGAPGRQRAWLHLPMVDRASRRPGSLQTRPGRHAGRRVRTGGLPVSAPVGTQLRWGTLETLLAAGDVAGVTDALVAADEQQRRSLAEAVRAYEVVPVELEHSGGGNEDYQREWLRMQELRTRRDDPVRVAGAGCLTRAADIVSFLRSGRYRQEPTPGATDAVIRVLQAPGRPAIAAVAQGLATRLRPAHLFGPQHVSGHWSLVAGLLHAAQLRPPGTEAMVRGWIRHLRRTGNGRLAERLHLDPWLPTLLPHVFDQHVPAELDEQWPPALAQLCSDGHLDRAELLSACLRRMRAGDRPGAMRPVIEIHRLLAPTIDERDAGPAAGTPDLLALAAAAAAATGAHGDFPELAAVVARGGRSRLVTEAARLSRTLTSDRR